MWMNDMLYNVSTAPSATRSSQTEKALESPGPGAVAPGSTGSPPLEAETRAAPRARPRSQRAPTGDGEALRFSREESSLHQLYRSVRETEETSRREKIEELRRVVNNGTFRPNLMVVAERLLSLGELGRF
jgi:anti-sigma28 factor (negative regulator of flagellin synthesis)